MRDESPLPIECLSLKSISSDNHKLSVRSSIIAAFGPEGPGILLVQDLPPDFQLHRERLFEDGYALPSIPKSELKALEFPEIHHSTGWSHGKEMFKGVMDTTKGSFYANPMYDDPSLGDADLQMKYPHNMHPNAWPSSNTLKNFESSFKYLGSLIHETGLKIAKHIDAIIFSQGEGTTCSGEQASMSLYETLRASRSQTGRLLHYFPQDNTIPSTSESETMWCGFHNDHSALTGLLSAQFFAASKSAQTEDSGGLYVLRASATEPQRVVIPPNCLAFQIGETAQIVTGGVLKATPHGVISPSVSGVTRVTLAVFLQPNPWVELRLRQDVLPNALESSELVPALTDRFKNGNTFQQFSERTYATFGV